MTLDYRAIQQEQRKLATQRKRLALILAGAFIALQAADIATTQLALAHGGWEANPLMAWAQRLGPLWPLVKLAPVAICLPLILRWTPRAVASLVGLQALVVANNGLTLLTM